MARTQRLSRNINLETAVVDNEIIQDLEQVTEAQNPQIVENNFEGLTSDDLLSSASEEIKSQIPKPEPTVNDIPEEQNSKTQGEAESTTPVEMAIAEAAQKFVKSDEQARLTRIRDGIEAGIEEIKDFNKGRTIGQLLALAQSTDISTSQLSAQLKQLRSHTDAQTSTVVKQALLEMGFNLTGQPLGEGENQSPLVGTVLAGLLPSRDTAPLYQLCEME